MECLKVPAQGPKTYPDRRRLSCWLVTALLICCWLYISALLMYFPIGLLVLFNKKDTLNTKMRFENKMQNENGSWFCSVFLFFFFVFFGLKVLDLFCFLFLLLRKFVQENAYLSIVKTKQKYTLYTPGHKCMFVCLLACCSVLFFFMLLFVSFSYAVDYTFN